MDQKIVTWTRIGVYASMYSISRKEHILIRKGRNTIQELYYWRELSKDEMSTMFDELVERWDTSDDYWFPLYDTCAKPVIAFDSAAFENQFGFAKLRGIMKDVNEIFEIREGRYEGYLVKSETFEPSYEGTGEGYWFDSSKEWIIYCSHEGSITFGGEWLIDCIKKEWKGWEKHIFMQL